MKKDLLDTLNDISSSLAVLALQVRAEARAGLGSRNKLAEHVLLPVFRRVYNSPNLINANTLAANFPGIDLYDPSSGLGVQVTSETRSTKITKTIKTLVGGTLPLTRLVIALAVETTPRYKSKTRARWVSEIQDRFAFDPVADVLAFDRLLDRVQFLPPPFITDIAAELRTLVLGTHQIHLLPHLRKQVDGQLAEEQRIARYIPDVFVETQDTKYQARCFAHPALFVRRIAGWFDRKPLTGLNRLATMSGVPPVITPGTRALTDADTPEDAAAVAQSIRTDVERLDATLAVYAKISREGGEAVTRIPARAYVFAETKYYIEIIANGMQYRTGNRRKELRCVTARIFLLTGPAGQGKTNFLCDFTERFLLQHEIPCAYITARQLSRIPDPDLTEVVRKLVFPAAVTSLGEGLANLEDACTERGKPFVLVIDGLNEHPDVRTFAGQLEYLLETLMRYPHVRVLMTCRSEFLEQRFAMLLSGPLEPFIHHSKAHGLRFDDEQYKELVDRYFHFFEVIPERIHPRVIAFLKRDVLLLRFFCEAYGARDRDDVYEQPNVTGVYRNEIFNHFVEDKLGRASRAVATDRSVTRPLVRKANLGRVLSLITSHMLENGQFMDVPRDVVPLDLDAELTVLLDEELVLRHDLSPTSSLLSEPSEVLNFTYDEMRDFLLAQHLLDEFTRDPALFDRLVTAQQPTTSQSLEGVQRFLFYTSRAPENGEFLEHYREHPWYDVVYDKAVFAVPPAYLNTEDQEIIVSALIANGDMARQIARELALRWESSVFPLLNLELLLDVARRGETSFFTDVIAPTFGYSVLGRDSLGEAFCNHVETNVLPTFDPGVKHPFDPIFNLLLLLLPLGATPSLDSQSFAVFHLMVSAHPGYAIGLLQEALNEGKRSHRPFLWRLLGLAGTAISDPSILIATAKADIADRNSDVRLRREANLFISRVDTTNIAS